MCEILIFADNDSHPDPKVNRLRCWKRGMPVSVKEDGHKWGSDERLPRFVVIKIPGVPVAKVEPFLKPQIEDDAGVPYYETIPEANPRRSVYRRKAWNIAWASLPAGIKDTLQTTGSITVSVAQIRNYLRRIRDDAVFTGLDA